METELKLALDPADAQRLRAAPALSGQRPRRTRMDGIYLDTPDCELARHGMALRLRRDGRRWMQCLKAGHSGAGGLHERSEWEYERPGAEVDLSLFRDTPLATLPSAPSLHELLQPAFRVTFDRITWQLAPEAGSRVEVALDRGEVRGAHGIEPLCEVEIECLEGGPRPAFRLAEELLDVAALRPSAVSKARRGYRLFRGEAMQPVRAGPSRVRRGMTPAGAARAIVRAGLEQLQANEEGVLASDDPEFVHQARVALRRVRSALKMFRKAIGRGRADAWRRSLARTARALGEARDWDVFAGETLPGLAGELGASRAAQKVAARAERRRTRARERAREALRSTRYAAAILRISRWLAVPRRERSRTTLEDFAHRLLRKRHERLVADLSGLAQASDEERHRARIDAKRLRYVVEGLAPALDAAHAKRYAKRLARLQDALGAANDAVTARRLLGKLRPPGEVASRAHDWFAQRIAHEARRLDRLAREIVQTEPLRRHA